MFAFVGGNLVLDLVGTVAERGTTDHEQLDSPEAAARWFVEARLLDAVPAVDDAGLLRVLETREALYRLLPGSSEPVRATDLAVVNHAALAQPPTVSFDRHGGVLRGGTLDAGLAAVARSYADVLEAPAGSLRWCEATACTRPYLDRSHGRRRRWCGMAGCGDRMKARAYRARNRPE